MTKRVLLNENISYIAFHKKTCEVAMESIKYKL